MKYSHMQTDQNVRSSGKVVGFVYNRYGAGGDSKQDVVVYNPKEPGMFRYVAELNVRKLGK